MINNAVPRPEPAGTMSIIRRQSEHDADTPSSITATHSRDRAHRRRRLRAHRECRATVKASKEWPAEA
jgi:hypothetical protein